MECLAVLLSVYPKIQMKFRFFRRRWNLILIADLTMLPFWKQTKMWGLPIWSLHIFVLNLWIDHAGFGNFTLQYKQLKRLQISVTLNRRLKFLWDGSCGFLLITKISYISWLSELWTCILVQNILAELMTTIIRSFGSCYCIVVMVLH
jgi:hypothetical protein